ncbi:2-hydroxyacyl-CoA dehydratase family protein [Paraburkholderia strydomiana]|uniref:2-hydroxyacyl-CoA dehydratase family protein n=1 Tax=Paraburkholderia strydomiana TaxID=1245417 RepID=A0ABW9EK15_9BURK
MNHSEPSREAALDAFRTIYEARGSLTGGPGKRIGYVSFNVPVELIEAAGCLPVRLTGLPLESTPRADRYLDPCFDGSTRSLMEQFLRGDFASLDLVIISRTSENTLQLYYFLLEIGRLEPEAPIPPVYLFDLLQTPYRASARYVRDQIDRLKARIETLTQQSIDDTAVADAIRLSNQHLDRFDELAALRHAVPARLTGEAALHIVGSLGRVPRARYVELLGQVLNDTDSAATLCGPRVIVKGSAHENADLYRYVEQCGAVIVEDEHLTGSMALGGKFDAALPPLDALAHRYRLHSPSLRRYPQASDDDRFIDTVQRAQADGVIFCYEDTDDVLGWDYSDQKARLDRLNLSSLRLLNQSYREPTDAGTLARVAEFIEGLRQPFRHTDIQSGTPAGAAR